MRFGRVYTIGARAASGARVEWEIRLELAADAGSEGVGDGFLVATKGTDPGLAQCGSVGRAWTRLMDRLPSISANRPRLAAADVP